MRKAARFGSPRSMSARTGGTLRSDDGGDCTGRPGFFSFSSSASSAASSASSSAPADKNKRKKNKGIKKKDEKDVNEKTKMTTAEKTHEDDDDRFLRYRFGI